MGKRLSDWFRTEKLWKLGVWIPAVGNDQRSFGHHFSIQLFERAYGSCDADRTQPSVTALPYLILLISSGFRHTANRIICSRSDLQHYHVVQLHK
jgi:hypothetical protein